MNDEIVNQNETLFELIESQIDILLAMFSRPVVQQQLLAIFLILLVAWIIPESLRRWWDRHKEYRKLPSCRTIQIPTLARRPLPFIYPPFVAYPLKFDHLAV